MLRLSFGSWPALVAAIEPMARIVGIRSEVLGQALHACDRRLVAAIVAVVAEKALRGEAVRNPCGYFSAMVQRARQGGLNLHRSLLGLCAPGFLQAGEGAEQGFYG